MPPRVEALMRLPGCAGGRQGGRGNGAGVRGLRYAGEAPLVGHEIAFDLEFLDPQALRLGLPRLAWNRAVLDTRLISSLVHGPDVSHSLEAVSERLGVTILARHSALGDALATAEVLVRLLDLLARRGITTLGELLEALERRPRP